MLAVDDGAGTAAEAPAVTAEAGFAAPATSAGWRCSTGAGVVVGALPQPASVPRIAVAHAHPTVEARAVQARSRHAGRPLMWLLILEALGAGALLVFIVWWTMFSGRPGGEPVRDDDLPD